MSQVNPSLKILHVLNHSVPHLDGYSVRSMDILKFQIELGWYPYAVTSPKQEPVPTVDVETIGGIRYFRTLPNANAFPRSNGLWFAFQLMQKRIREIVSNEHPNVVHAHSPCTWGFAAARVARQCKLPFVYELRGIWEDSAVARGRLREKGLRYRLRRLLETFLARRADAVVTISAGLQREFTNRGVKDVFVVPNGVDLVRFAQMGTRPKPIEYDGVTISYIGSLCPWEGVEDLVRAAVFLKKSEFKVRVRIVGTGETEKLIAELIERLSLSDTVEMLGHVPHDQINEVYERSDVLVYPRRRSRITEVVTPLKPLEAMAQEKPIVISDVAGLTELIDKKSALVFEAENASDLAEKCLQLVRSEDLRRELGTSARIHVQRHRNWADLIRIYSGVYDHAKSSLCVKDRWERQRRKRRIKIP